ncbi:MAG: YggS family pyridoxal phosphate-dependent enzyme [Gemmatimonadota bacterium]|nr:YggS family pyridoxal phosphate-dependent enzyme [Gemmatimonadota bacterium]MDP7031919.1 YggS family pyridoxal phosphate-dependent enzyme [Gemmatimonadota bacterium]
MSPVAANLERIRARIAGAARRAGRDPAEVRLCAVTKTVGPEEVREAVAAGVRILGENRLQVASPKIREVGELPPGVEWHFIGPLQGNKARRAVGLFAEIQSVDRLSLAERISRIAGESGRVVPVLLEVKTSGEPAKHGFALEEVEGMLDPVEALPGIAVRGLMTMAPFTQDEEPVRAAFRALRELRDSLGGAARLPDLSMGMTGDFEIAVEEGSTMVRIGTGIFTPGEE